MFDNGIRGTNGNIVSKRNRPGNPTVAIGYVRVSTSAQELGPEAQRAQVEAWAVREGIQVAAWFVDAGVRGEPPSRRVRPSWGRWRPFASTGRASWSSPSVTASRVTS
jgi:hypothetical protein